MASWTGYLSARDWRLWAWEYALDSLLTELSISTRIRPDLEMGVCEFRVPRLGGTARQRYFPTSFILWHAFVSSLYVLPFGARRQKVSLFTISHSVQVWSRCKYGQTTAQWILGPTFAQAVEAGLSNIMITKTLPPRRCFFCKPGATERAVLS